MAVARAHARATPRHLRRRDREHYLSSRWRNPARPGRDQRELGLPRGSLTGASGQLAPSPWTGRGSGEGRSVEQRLTGTPPPPPSPPWGGGGGRLRALLS